MILAGAVYQTIFYCVTYIRTAFAVLYDITYWKRTLPGINWLIKKPSVLMDFPNKILILYKNQSKCKSRFFQSGKLQLILVGFHFSDKWVKNQTMAWAFIPQCSFFHNNHIIETSGWVSQLLLLLPRSCTAQSLPPP